MFKLHSLTLLTLVLLVHSEISLAWHRSFEGDEKNDEFPESVEFWESLASYGRRTA